ncbi:uncharacterized protein LOC110247274 [Exaiptasia diaphana]|uniref:Uncharacterized protein n=1 Tax=Exaiptasia diaphana TaxID=2652724 RepID=A0A913XUH6_EXADI|nr:uncharacterized protein LOC110247274 [Exaiptasia diaphana]KXJ24796.1 hypothetical protein AC249_AIPGENE21006 [Exaiptasia diaphana]
MAGHCLGGFSYGYRRNTSIYPEQNEVVWVNRRYNPLDLRSSAPVPRSKFLMESEKTSENNIPLQWKKEVEPSLKTFSRHMEEPHWYPSTQASRCEEWSTLRQILPSRGIRDRVIAPRWGTNILPNASFQPKKENRFPHINSPMTRFVDDMHLTNRLFKLH